MKKTFLFTVFCLLITASAYAGQIQISTYYPSPFGYYERLKFNPRTSLTEPCEPGTVYYLSGTGLKYCAEDTTWKTMGGGVWTQTVNNIYPADTATNPNLRVGIGTTSPASSLHVYAPQGDAPPGVFLDDTDISVDGGADGIFGLRNMSASGTRKITMGGPGLGTEVMTIDAQNSRVGIGTTAPIANFQINNADAVFSSSGQTPHGSVHLVGTRPYITFSDINAADPTDAWRIGAWDEDFVISEEDDSINKDLDLFFIQRGTGNVHIGDNFTSSPNPTAKLHIMQDAVANAFRVDDQQGDTSPFIIDSDGNVGIGTTAPQAELDVVGDARVNPALQLFPTDAIDPAAACTIKGRMYYDNSDNTIYVCNESNIWKPLWGNAYCAVSPDRDTDGYDAIQCGGNDCLDDPGVASEAPQINPIGTGPAVIDLFDNDCDGATDEEGGSTNLATTVVCQSFGGGPPPSTGKVLDSFQNARRICQRAGFPDVKTYSPCVSFSATTYCEWNPILNDWEEKGSTGCSQTIATIECYTRYD